MRVSKLLLLDSNPALDFLQITQRIVYAVLIKFVTIGSTNGLGTLWAPVWLRNLLTNFLLHIGGIHSGRLAIPCQSFTCRGQWKAAR